MSQSPHRFDKPLPSINADESSSTTPRAAPKSLSHEASTRSFDAAHGAVFRDTNPSKRELKIDEIAERVEEAAEGPISAYEALSDFYEENEEAIKSAAETIASLEVDSKTLESTISAFSETSKVVIAGLEALSEVHPFISAAVVAFKLVITLNVTRGENTRKVIGLKVQMQNTMVALFQLRHMRDPDVRGPDNITIQDRMQGLIHILAKDIEETGSFCDHYLKKGFLAKTLKSQIYERRLARYADRFVYHRQNLEFEMNKHAALGIDTANTKLDSQSSQLTAISSHLEDMLALMKRLETPRERELGKFIKEKGGPHVCVQNNQLLMELIEMSGEGLGSITSSRSGDPEKDLASAKWALSRELEENLDVALTKNWMLFEKKLEAQGRQMKVFFESSLRQEGEHIISTILAGAHERIVDPDMQAIWRDMGWKSSVKARHFVLALQDYFTQKFKIEAANNLGNSAYLSPASTISLLSLFSNAFSSSTNIPRERWAVAHIHVAHVQPILEAIDDDGTGFISINEVNTFVGSRPDGWSLPLWICYWAAGWHASIHKYQSKIYSLIQRMFYIYNLVGVLPANRRSILEYLCHYSFTRIDFLLRSTRKPESTVTEDHALRKLMEVYTETEEDRLEKGLETFGYEIDTADTVELITGPGRIERFVYPLLYLLLKRQLKVMYLACDHVLDPEEFIAFNGTLMSIFGAVDERIAVLTSIFRQTHSDVRDRLGNFAFGMLQLSSDTPAPDTKNNSLAMVSYYDPDVDAVAEEIFSVDILKYGTKDSLDSRIYDFEENFVLDGNLVIPAADVKGAGNTKQTKRTEDATKDSKSTSVPTTKDAKDTKVTVKDARDTKNAPTTTDGTKDTKTTAKDVKDATGVGTTTQTIPVSPKHPLEGYWAGHLWTEDSKEVYSTRGLFQIFIKSVDGKGQVIGVAENYLETMVVSGRLSSNDMNGGTDVKLVFRDDSDGYVMVLKGTLDLKRETLSGTHRLAGYDVDVIDMDRVSDVRDDGTLDPLAELENLAKLSSPVLEEAPVSLDLDSDATSSLIVKRTFSFNRTPASAWKFRAHPSQLDRLQTARERWMFAYLSVRDLVRQQKCSWSYLKERFAERRRFLEFSIRQKVDWLNYTPRMPLSAEERIEFRKLVQNIHPGDGRFYSSLVVPLLGSIYEHHPFTCDSCGREIIGSRLLCLQRRCLEDNYSFNVNLCVTCRDTTPGGHDWQHLTSHSLLKLDYAPLDSDMAWIIPEARVIVDRVKGVFRTKESVKPGSDKSREVPESVGTSDNLKNRQTNNMETICCCCRKEVSLPCWVCQYCSPDAYICDECEAKKMLPLEDGPAPWHDPNQHHVIRIKNSQVVLEAPTVETRLVSLEKKLSDLETKLEVHLKDLDEGDESRQALTRRELGGHVKSLEDKLEHRLAGLESLLQGIIGRLQVPGVPLTKS
ncbi:hypothetical protein K435DRAFT_718738 [Dendrothele bispora CBS 962.96]|uniref:Uncharacterized protein n=1 Tax=Dendrothele bispora (strain CBS 962.96) TaxID=1314807 RepID=A0A4S8MDW2_DENBC|nr:hypothetical protein K435DRAFT_718738 [Dendrothele bispora CBS 962.96]